ncbi:MAG: hypothetical protein O2894_14005, partial [Planctomycetota bacterium]|nr:hypothetical protein [Planctomycetota bacterium]
LEPTDRLARARDVLAFVRPVEVACVGRPAPAGLLTAAGTEPDGIEALELRLADDTAGRLQLGIAATVGRSDALAPEHEKVVRALLDAPPLPQAGPPPPARLVALLGVLRALDRALVEQLLARAQTSTLQVAARGLPRENTRKAPLVRHVAIQLTQAFPQLPVQRAEEIATATAHAKLAARHLDTGGAAVLVALLGRKWNAGGQPISDALRLTPLSAEEVEALVGELSTIAAVRRDLEAGRTVEAARIARLEHAALAVLARLDRLPAP